MALQRFAMSHLAMGHDFLNVQKFKSLQIFRQNREELAS